jgi:hypothetical protein
MKIRMLILAASIIFSAPLFAGGDDAWKLKAYTEWSAQDVDRILSNSPWARSVGGASGGNTKVTESTAPEVNRKGETVHIIGDHKTETTTPTTYYRDYAVMWLSSRTIREALARKMQLEGNVSEDQARQLADHTSQYYVVVVSPGAYFFGDKPPEEIVKEAQTAAYLESKQTKMKLAANKVQFFTQAPLAGSLAFYFPKTDANGAPTFSPDESEIQFSCAAPKEKIKAKFDLKQMVRDGKPDLL